MDKLRNANYIKSLFIDYLLMQHPNSIIGSEVVFAYKKFLADLINLRNNYTYAYEIKAKNDDFRKIESQLREYNKVFDFVSLIVTEKHLIKAQNIVPLYNGIILIKNNLEIECIQEPIQNLFLVKEDLLETMTIKFIVKYFNIVDKKKLAYLLRKTLMEKDSDELRNALFSFLYTRIERRFLNFLNEKGVTTHYEDISLLSMPIKKIVI